MLKPKITKPAALQELSATDLLEIMCAFNDSIAILDTHWRFAYVNKKGWEVLNRPRKEVMGHNVWELFPHLIGTKFEVAIKYSMKTQKMTQIDEYYPHRDMYAQTKFYPTSKFIMMQATDVTELMHERSVNDKLMGDLHGAMELYWSQHNRHLRHAKKMTKK
jgi:PAS domain-containing protein